MLKEPIHILNEVFGYDSFRKGQEELIRHILQKRDTLGIMPTGAGKSVCYQIPALAAEGSTLVVSPLISLMKDQVDALRQNGVDAAALNSSMDWSEAYEALEAVRSGRVRLLYVAPERLENEHFKELLRSLDVSLLVVDEAHCVSQWGHDFRPSYLKIAETVAAFAVRPTVAAFTATATPEVRDDIALKLGLENPYLLTTGFDRENLFFQVEHPKDKMGFVLKYVEKTGASAGIIYCSTRKNVEEVCERLRENGTAAVRYHAGLAERERRANQEAFIHDRASVMVATNAFGMGIDKSNVRYVLHYNMPNNLDAYYQEAGRAGRDGFSADCVLLFSPRDIHTARFFIEQSADSGSRQAGYRKLQAIVNFCNTHSCLRKHILNYFGEGEAGEPCGNCGSCVSLVNRTEVTLEAQKILSCVYRMTERDRQRPFGSALLIDVLRGSSRKQVKELEFDTLSTWGIMKEYRREEIGEMVHFLVAEGYLESSDSEFPVLSFSPKSLPFLKNRERLYRRTYAPKAAEPSVKNEARAHTDLANAELFELLRTLRKQIATEQNVPPYVVFFRQHAQRHVRSAAS